MLIELQDSPGARACERASRDDEERAGGMYRRMQLGGTPNSPNTLVPTDATHSDLIVTFSDRADGIRIGGWSTDKSLGNTFVDDFVKRTVGTAYVFGADGNCVSDGVPPDAQVLILEVIGKFSAANNRRFAEAA